MLAEELGKGTAMTVKPPAFERHPAEAYRRAWQLLEERDPRTAIELLDPAIDAEPGSTSLRTLRAWAYFQTAQLDHAESELAVLVEECPTDVWARFALGRVLERRSRYAVYFGGQSDARNRREPNLLGAGSGLGRQKRGRRRSRWRRPLAFS